MSSRPSPGAPAMTIARSSWRTASRRLAQRSCASMTGCSSRASAPRRAASVYRRRQCSGTSLYGYELSLSSARRSRFVVRRHAVSLADRSAVLKRVHVRLTRDATAGPHRARSAGAKYHPSLGRCRAQDLSAPLRFTSSSSSRPKRLAVSTLSIISERS